MTSLLVACGCDRWRYPDGRTTCISKATQEDFLCDACRAGCAAVFIGDWCQHTAPSEITLTRSAR